MRSMMDVTVIVFMWVIRNYTTQLVTWMSE